MSAGVINKKHESIEDRGKYACVFRDTFEIKYKIYLDNMKNDALTKLACWPFRYFVIDNGKFVKIGMPSESQFDLLDLYECLVSYK